MCCWSGGRGTLTELSLCYSSVYHYNGAQWYEQFLQVSWLGRALILLCPASCLPSTSLSVLMVLYIFKTIFTFFTLGFSELSLLALTIGLIECYDSVGWVVNHLWSDLLSEMLNTILLYVLLCVVARLAMTRSRRQWRQLLMVQWKECWDTLMSRSCLLTSPPPTTAASLTQEPASHWMNTSLSLSHGLY